MKGLCEGDLDQSIKRSSLQFGKSGAPWVSTRGESFEIEVPGAIGASGQIVRIQVSPKLN
mgnify:FL=1